MPSVKPGGPTIDLSGQEVRRASLSAAQAKEAGLLMTATFGRRGFGSSTSADLAWSLVSKLRPVTASVGSTLFKLTWKTRVTPSGRSISALRASARRTSGSGCTSWPTPNAGPQNATDSKWEERREELAEKYGNNGFGMTLGMASQLTASGETPNGSTVGTISGGQLNPHLSRWLMGLPSEWCQAGVRAFRSLKKDRQKRRAE
jgi:hypothetical protein